jgi:CRP-like cAMP-binding protein
VRSDGRGVPMRPRVFRPGELVFFEGMHGEEAFLLKEGAVEIFRSSNSGEMVLATILPGDIFGEMALVDSRPRSASARCVGIVVATPIPRRLLEQELARSPLIVRTLVERYIRIIRDANRRLGD